MATQIIPVELQSKVRIDPYFETLFGKKASTNPVRIDGALLGLLRVVESDPSQMRTASALLFRAQQAGLIKEPITRARYERLVQPQARKHATRPADKPMHERKGPPAVAVARKQRIRGDSLKLLARRRGTSVEALQNKKQGGKKK